MEIAAAIQKEVVLPGIVSTGFSSRGSRCGVLSQLPSHWPELKNHEAEIRGLIANVCEAYAVAVSPLDRVMRIARRKKELEVQTTNNRWRSGSDARWCGLPKGRRITSGPIATSWFR